MPKKKKHQTKWNNKCLQLQDLFVTKLKVDKEKNKINNLAIIESTVIELLTSLNEVQEIWN